MSHFFAGIVFSYVMSTIQPAGISTQHKQWREPSFPWNPTYIYQSKSNKTIDKEIQKLKSIEK